MIERLGNVIFWACSLAAVIWITALLFMFLNDPSRGPGLLAIGAALGIPSILIFLIGWAVRYVLTGK